MSTQRSTLRGAAGAALTALMLGGLGGCALLDASPDAPLTGVAACALGKTWNLDTAKLAETLTAELASRGLVATVTAEGSQTLRWDLTGAVVLDSSYTLTSTSADQQSVVTQEHSGTATGTAYINSEVAIPRHWDASGVAVTTTATLGGAPQDGVPYTFPRTDIDDSVGVELTCDGGTMTTHQRGSNVTLTWVS